MGNHYVPREYLRGFADPVTAEALWQFDKLHGTFSDKPASIAKIAQQRSFYDGETERALNNLVEIPGNKVLRKLRYGDHDLNEEERLSLAVYMATMIKRVPRHRARIEEMAPKTLTNLTSELRALMDALADSGQISAETANDHVAEIDAVEARFTREMPESVRDRVRKPWPTVRVIDLIYRMHWRYVAAGGGEFFVTTDNPVFFFECWGLGTERSEMTFPVSSDLAIFGSWTPVTARTKNSGRPQIVKEANRRLIVDAERFVYSKRQAGWIAAVAAKQRPHLSSIRW